ncbi:putative signal transducing protein [Rhodanobacter sp. BL-MT-08]
MHIIYRADNLFDAHLVKDALEAEGIPAFIAGEYLTGAVGQLPAMDYIAVMVPESSLPAASDIVREVEAQLSEARLAMEAQEDAPDDPLVVFC